MATLIYDSNSELLYLEISDREKGLVNNDSKFYINCLFHDHSDNNIDTHKILDMFNKSVDKYPSKTIIAENINPWIMCINWNLVVYFGEDKPVIKSKTIKTCTSSYKKWTRYNWKQNKLETYYYANVKEPHKLFIFGNTYRFNYREDVENIEGQYITKFDMSDKVYKQKVSEKIKKEKEELQRRIQYQKELEEQKHTPGYCSYCGAAGALFTPNPYNVDMNGDYTPVWICSHCYESYLGDI